MNALSSFFRKVTRVFTPRETKQADITPDVEKRAINVPEPVKEKPRGKVKEINNRRRTRGRRIQVINLGKSEKFIRHI